MPRTYQFEVSTCGKFAIDRVGEDTTVYNLAYYSDGSKYWIERKEPLPDGLVFEVEDSGEIPDEFLRAES